MIYSFSITSYIWRGVTSQTKVLSDLPGTKKVVFNFFLIPSVRINMTQNQKNSKRTSSKGGVNIVKAIEKFLEDERNKNKETGSSAQVGGSFDGASVSRKTLVTRMKVVKKNIMEESDSEADKDWITFPTLIRHED